MTVTQRLGWTIGFAGLTCHPLLWRMIAYVVGRDADSDLVDKYMFSTEMLFASAMAFLSLSIVNITLFNPTAKTILTWFALALAVMSIGIAAVGAGAYIWIHR